MNVQRAFFSHASSASIPHAPHPDSTIPLLLDPYRFIARTSARLGTDVFQTRLMLQPAICMVGKEAAELFCDTSRFMRSGATPMRIQKTLFGVGGVQGLDGEAHRHRKAMFMALVAPERVQRLSAITAEQLQARARVWERSDGVTLYPEIREILTRSVCAWAGVPLAEKEVRWRTAELTALFDRAAAVGPPHWWARLARMQTDRWCAGLVEQVREGRLKPPAEAALYQIAHHRDLDGELLDAHTAGVELLNVIRPTVAVSVFAVFVALALHDNPTCRDRLGSDDAFVEAFVQEVRRLYPFFPATNARVSRDFEWNGLEFPQGTRVMMDLYGTNHDARIWEEPDAFRPERFLGQAVKEYGTYGFIPQGPGSHHVNHRCPGEGITIELMKLTARFLSTGIRYEVPQQDLQLEWRRMPALPRSRFVMRNITAAA